MKLIETYKLYSSKRFGKVGRVVNKIKPFKSAARILFTVFISIGLKLQINYVLNSMFKMQLLKFVTKIMLTLYTALKRKLRLYKIDKPLGVFYIWEIPLESTNLESKIFLKNCELVWAWF